MVLRGGGLRLHRGREGGVFLVRYTEVVGEGLRTLEEGSEVEFEIVEGRGGRKQAARVEVVG